MGHYLAELLMHLLKNEHKKGKNSAPTTLKVSCFCMTQAAITWRSVRSSLTCTDVLGCLGQSTCLIKHDECGLTKPAVQQFVESSSHYVRGVSDDSGSVCDLSLRCPQGRAGQDLLTI